MATAAAVPMNVRARGGGGGGGEAPKGNWVARNLRLMNNDSKELFPKTPAEGKERKYDSLYTVDYHEFPADVFREGLMPKGQQPVRETIRDVLFGNSPTSTFTNWRIPKRISGECEDARIGDHVGKVPPEKVATPALLRQSTLPAIAASRSGPREFVPKPRVSASDSLRRAKTTLDLPASRAMSQQSAVAQWQERFPEVDGRLLRKVLRLQGDPRQGPASLRQSLKGSQLLPDARRTVERWMESASEGERQVALKFFSSMAGGRLMGLQGDEQGARLKDVVEALQGVNNSRWVAEGGLSPRGRASCSGGQDGGSDSKRLRYLQLLDDDTRRQRWMHTTWHHLPNYRPINPVTNWSSHYVRPNQAQHRHFVIHPDWPPV
ncbi:uncharacterized protein LOC143276008 [Babylonia areolata]|uniref:uncharacterized protein LOC143276008 n=1 Tax=Babylonia areolata TaxID=304850 RepID=UPI003FD0FDB3